MIQNHLIPTGHWSPREALTKTPAKFFKGRFAVAMLAVLVLSGCSNLIPDFPAAKIAEPAAPKSFFGLYPAAFKDLPGWVADNHAEALPAFIRSCDKIEKLPEDKAMGKYRQMGKVADWLPLCASARIIRPDNNVEAQYFFESKFIPYSIRDSQNKRGLFTGYYEPDLNGAFGPDNRYRFPLYAKPKDLIGSDLGQFDNALKGRSVGGRIANGKFVPYYTRAEIEAGALAGQQLETLWVDNLIDAFILHIQGSGRVVLSDGSHVRVGYAGRNGHRYTAIGRELVAAGALRLEDVTMPAIREWMEANPAAAVALMQKNKSFIFFRVVEGAGPIGAQGVALTPGRSLAVDRAYFPMGVPMWVDFRDPGTSRQQFIRRVVIAQDTGSAIKGVVRGDFFWGNGREAATKAGIMKEFGEYHVLLPRSAATALQTN